MDYEKVFEHFKPENILRLITNKIRWESIDLVFKTKEDAIKAYEKNNKMIDGFQYKIRIGLRNKNYDSEFAQKLVEGSFGWPRDFEKFPDERRGRGRGRRGNRRGRGRNNYRKYEEDREGDGDGEGEENRYYSDVRRGRGRGRRGNRRGRGNRGGREREKEIKLDRYTIQENNEK